MSDKRSDPDESAHLQVFFDGSCPLCSREIALYRGMHSEQAIRWIDASAAQYDEQAYALPQRDALESFHVQTPDGSMVAGPQAFHVLWSSFPATRWMAWIGRRPILEPIQRLIYRLIQRARGTNLVERAHFRNLPASLQRDLRSNHAGELGAVQFYRAVVLFTRDNKLRYFAKRHLVTERRHLELMTSLVPRGHRSKLCPMWIIAAWTLALTALLGGSPGVYATIDGIERFVEQHYLKQISELSRLESHPELVAHLSSCCQDEIQHGKEAREAHGDAHTMAAKVWRAVIYHGSQAAVRIARRV